MTAAAQVPDSSSLRQALDRDGVFRLPGFLSPAQLADIADAFAWSEQNRGPGFTTLSGDENSWQDLSNPAAREAYSGMLERSPIPGLLRELWQCEHVWFMYEQIFCKRETDNFTPWHQDTSYQPVEGDHVGVVWISLDRVAREQALEFCVGSHRGPLYNASKFTPGDPTDPLYTSGDMPRLPDIEADRDSWDIVGWDTEPGDIVVFHPQVLHGGGSPGPAGLRRTLTLRFFGDDATYASRPGPTAAPQVAGLHESLSQGDPFRHPDFQLLVAP